MNIILAALRSFIPTLIAKAFEAASSKKVVASALGFLGVTQTDDLKKQIAGVAITGTYVLAQAIHDAAKEKAKAK
jgi:hypothetical protein